jgi:protein-S-isoprenylcysteine O-methyltransferase Ste14
MMLEVKHRSLSLLLHCLNGPESIWQWQPFLYAGVYIFTGTEEKQLTAAFGKTYEDSLKRVDASIPFKNLK